MDERGIVTSTRLRPTSENSRTLRRLCRSTNTPTNSPRNRNGTVLRKPSTPSWKFVTFRVLIAIICIAKGENCAPNTEID